MKDLNSEKINTASLKEYKQPKYGSDYFQETSDSKYLVVIYNIDEWRMLCYAGLVAIYNRNDDFSLILNSDIIWIWFDDENTFDYAPLSDCIIFRKPAFNSNSNKPDFPFLLIKPSVKLFSFLEWDSSSIHYGFNELEKDVIQVKEVHSNDVESLSKPLQSNSIFKIDTLNWYNLVDFDQALELYFENQ